MDLAKAEFLKLSAARRSSYMLRHGVKYGFNGNLLALPLTAVAAAAAPRGDKLATAVAAGTSVATFPVIQAAAAAGLALIPGIGQGTLLFLSMLAAFAPSAATDDLVSRSIKSFSRFGRRRMSLQTGQDFEDSQFAANYRQQALMEMSGTVQTARRYLGREAFFAHR